MSYSTFGYGATYPASAQLTGVPATSPGSTGSGSNLSPSCGGEGGPAVSPLSSSRTGSGMAGDPMAGQILSDSSHLAALSGYSRLGGSMTGLGSGMYPGSYPTSEQNPYPSISMDNSAFYGSLSQQFTVSQLSSENYVRSVQISENIPGATKLEQLETNPYSAMREGGGGGGGAGGGGGDMTSWTAGALPPSAASYYSYDHPSLAYSYGGYGDLAARRKNATRESTATLKAWLNEHKKNPYPTKGEKIMLAIITKMTLTQVSTWFANARRRLKKENKMTWEPKNKLDDEDVDVSDDEDKDNSFCRDEKSDCEEDPRREMGHHGMGHRQETDKDDSKEGIPIPPSKPKIWSMAEMAVCKTPPPNSQHWNYPSLHQASALRSGMFGMGGRPDYQHPKPDFQHPNISAESKLLPSISQSSHAGFSSSEELKTETPPHTPPNGVKMMGSNNVINMQGNEAQSYSHYAVPQQYSSMHSYDEDKSCVQYSNDSINMSNNIYNGNSTRL